MALLIGNNQYATTPLRNAVNDARDLGATLKELGFRVIVKENATRKDMIDGLREFGAALEGANTALFFYAGHACSSRSATTSSPSTRRWAARRTSRFFSVEVNQVFDRMERAQHALQLHHPRRLPRQPVRLELQAHQPRASRR